MKKISLNLFSFEDNSQFIIIKILGFAMKFNKQKWFPFLIKKEQIKPKVVAVQPTQKAKIDVTEYVKKYGYILETKLPNIDVVLGYENCIWQCWLQGYDDAPDIIKTAMNTVERKNPNLRRIIITEDNLAQYVDLPDYIKNKYERGIISRTHLSDYIRLCLLEKYGGIWVDASCYFTDCIPEEILQAPFFQFKATVWALVSEVPSENMRKSIAKYTSGINSMTGSNWFLHAYPKNPIICRVKQLLDEYWRCETCLVDYFIFHCFLTFAVMHDSKCRAIFNEMPTFANIYPHILQNVFSDLYNETLWRDISGNSFVHKLKWKNVSYSKDENNFYNFLLNNETQIIIKD